MKFNEFIDKALKLCSVPKCISCKGRLGMNELALCDQCRKAYDNIVDRTCSVCLQKLDRCLCVNKQLDSHYVHKLIKLGRYVPDSENPLNCLIYSFKRQNRKDVLDFLATELSRVITDNLGSVEGYVFTNVPRRRKSIVKYGFDHAQMLARECAKRLGAEYLSTLSSASRLEQKKASGIGERLSNLKIKPINEKLDLSGKRVILFDDIVTTGSSMSVCAANLKIMGAKSVIGATISIAFRDEYSAFDKTDRFAPKG